MYSFNYQNPTKIVFGKGSIQNLGKEVLNYGSKVLLVYGSSLKRTGNYDTIVNVLKDNGIEYCDLPDISVPSLENLYKGIKIAKENKVDVVLGIGGGCCIDMAKSIAIGAVNDVDIWDVLTKKVPWDDLDVLPIGAIVTVAGSGSEMDGNSEIDNLETGEHGSIGSFVKTYPTFSILDPELTYSCPWLLTAYHGFTIVVQAMEQYLVDVDDCDIQDGFVETIVRTVIKSLRTLKTDLNNENARGNLLWASAITTNRLLGRGKNAPWLGGPLGGLIDDYLGLSYSQGIAITWPKYLMVCAKDNVKTLKSFAVNVMNIDPTNKTDKEVAYEGAKALQDFVIEMDMADTVLDLCKDHHELSEFEDKINKLASRGVVSKEDLETIVSLSLGGK